MDLSENWRLRATLELQQGEAARAVGNEGRARVCARRAMGVIAEEYFKRKGVYLNTPSAYDILRHLLSSQDIPPEAREKTAHFLLRVDVDFSLPDDIDLLAEARWLAGELLGEQLLD